MNTFGTLLRVHIFGESHGEKIGIIIDGIPAGLIIDYQQLLSDITRRKSGEKGTTPRIEDDVPQIVSGVFNNITTGAPLTIIFDNHNTQSKDYSNLITHPRPGHADFTGKQKFNGYNDYRGGGHFSGRITLPLVVAGTIAKTVIPDIKITAKITMIGGKSYETKDEVIDYCITHHDSVGAIIECSVENMPIGLGEPFFNSLESLISHAIFSIPGIRGIEFGSGFESAGQWGSEHNDCIMSTAGKTKTNHAGGINGGISNGNELVFRIAVKPTSSIGLAQNTFNFSTQKIEPLEIKGRHDICFALRVPVIVEALTAIVLADLTLQHNSR